MRHASAEPQGPGSTAPQQRHLPLIPAHAYPTSLHHPCHQPCHTPDPPLPPSPTPLHHPSQLPPPCTSQADKPSELEISFEFRKHQFIYDSEQHRFEKLKYPVKVGPGCRCLHCAPPCCAVLHCAAVHHALQ